jgi:RND family efflux transporter MFP subunit
VSIQAEVHGIVEERRAEVGTHVRKGQLLFVIGAKRLRPEPDNAPPALSAPGAKPERRAASGDSNVQRALGDVKEANIPVQAAEAEPNHYGVYAPIDGRVRAVKVQLGDLVRPASAGQESSELATIEQLDRIGISIPVDSRFFRRAAQCGHAPSAVSVSSPGFGDRDCPNNFKLSPVDAKCSPNTESIVITTQIDNRKHSLVPGETIRVTISFGEIANAVVVPEQAIFDTGGVSCAYLVNPQRRIEIVRVKAGFTYDRMRVIESGIEPGQTVMVDGFAHIRSGREVRCEHVSHPSWDSQAKPQVTVARP